MRLLHTTPGGKVRFTEGLPANGRESQRLPIV